MKAGLEIFPGSSQDVNVSVDYLKAFHPEFHTSFVFQNKDGRVTKRDFRRVLESFCFRMSQKQFHELMAKIDPYNKGYVSYLDFLDRFEQRETEVSG